MTYKLTCPGCDRYTSAVFRAYAAGRDCPHCGASVRTAAPQYYAQLPDSASAQRRPALAESVARRIWAAKYVNPTLPVPLPFDELDPATREILHTMAEAAIDEITKGARDD